MLIEHFDPNGPGQNNGNLFGLPFSPDDADIVLIPVPWDITTSYGTGTFRGPQKILEASLQVDLYDSLTPNAWEAGIAMLDIPEGLRSKNRYMRVHVEKVLDELECDSQGISLETELQIINKSCEDMVHWVYSQARDLLKKKKIVGVLGGDHSTPLGLMKALAEAHESFGILQIDAHLDLRAAYEGFTYSHASIMYNALKIPQVKNIYAVGIRDYCEEEAVFVQKESDRVTFSPFREQIRQRFLGKNWATQVKEIIQNLPQKVYISFDIDGLDPSLCPNTGTPVPGGLQFEEAMYLVDEIVASGREIVGFDLCEVCPGENEWDANVGARVLFRLFCAIIRSRAYK